MQAFEHKSFNELFDLTGKTAIVTGGANGIGKATALRLAQAGANIVIADLKLEDANKAAKEIESYGVKALAVECNILKDFAAPISEWVSGQTLFVNGGGVQTLD